MIGVIIPSSNTCFRLLCRERRTHNPPLVPFPHQSFVPARKAACSPPTTTATTTPSGQGLQLLFIFFFFSPPGYSPRLGDSQERNRFLLPLSSYAFSSSPLSSPILPSPSPLPFPLSSPVPPLSLLTLICTFPFNSP